MISVESLINNICNKLNSSAYSSGVKYVPEFPKKKQDMPLRSPIVSVGADKITVEPQKDATSLKKGASPSYVRLKFYICVPKSSTGNACYAVLDKFIAASKSLLETHTIIGIETEEMKYSSSVNGLVLPVVLTLSTGHAYSA